MADERKAKPHVKKYQKPEVKMRPLLTRAFLFLFLAVLGWLVYVNLPMPEFEVSPLEGNIASSENSLREDANQASLEQASANDSSKGSFKASQPNDSEVADAKPVLPFNVSVVYSPGYLISLGGLEKLHPFDIKKYQKIHNGLLEDGLLTEAATLKPAPVTDEELLLIHTEQYLEDLKDRAIVAKYLEAGVLQSAPVSLNRVVDPFKRATGGTILAARMALKNGIGINIGGGYHHAKPDRGEGFCLFADVPIAIRKLQNEGLIKRAVIIDVDVHQGNGTILCLDDDPTTYTFSMHQGNIYPSPKEVGDRDVELSTGMEDEGYLSVLEFHLESVLDEADADICFIVGGCDPLKGDPLASLEMTPAGIVARDNDIVSACVKRKLPVVLTLSGGYSPDAWKSQYMSIKNLIESNGLAESVPSE